MGIAVRCLHKCLVHGKLTRSCAACRLAGFLCGFEIFQITVRSGYGVTEFKADLLSLYTKTGVKSIPVVFILTDNQIIDERFLVYVNDLLSTGYIADLCTAVSCHR